MSEIPKTSSAAEDRVEALSLRGLLTQLATVVRHPEWRTFFLLAGIFTVAYFLPVESLRFQTAVSESLQLVKWYAREHVLLCLVPAFFIAGGISVFVSQASVMRYLGPNAPKWLAYGVASVSGTILAVCSCTVLPLFGGIYLMGAGLGPAITFLYSGPAINVLAIVLTARVLGFEIGVARAIGAILLSVLAGALIHLLFRREEQRKAQAAMALVSLKASRPLWQTALYFASLVGILVFANWSKPLADEGLWAAIYSHKWLLTAVAGLVLAGCLWGWMGASTASVGLGVALTAGAALFYPHTPEIAFVVSTVSLAVVCATGSSELREWGSATWTFAKQIFPLLFAGVFVAGLLLGRPGHEGVIPNAWVQGVVGGNSLGANLFASVAGALMYFATLTEVPILQGLLGSGMGKGPALALLLAGPALSLPSLIVLRSIMGLKKTVAFAWIVIVVSTLAGLVYGTLLA